MTNNENKQITAREVEARENEKLLVFGPVLEQLNQDLLDPLVDITFAKLLEAGRIPPAPESLGGRALDVEYISIMAQAQKLANIGGIERFSRYIGEVATVKPAILDKIKEDELANVYAEITSVPPNIIATDEEVKEIREVRAEQEAAAQRAEQQASEAATMKQLSETDTGKESALSDLLGGDVA